MIIGKHAELRRELSNPAIGSNAHLRKLALSLLDELEAKDIVLSARDYHFDQQADRIESLEKSLNAAEARIAELTAPDGNAIAWESTTPVYIKFITDERYRRLRPGYQKWYKPYRCSNCAAGISVKGE